MESKIKVTTDHDVIKAWAQKYGGRPEIIDDPEALSDKVGIRIDFPGKNDDTFLNSQDVKDSSWDDFFKQFELQSLAFIYLPDVSSYNSDLLSRAYRFIKRDVLESEEQNSKEFKDLIKSFIEYYKSGNLIL